MDPRHPELAVARLKELIKQYDRIESDMNSATVASMLGQLEREGGLVVQEICLVAPRLHEAMMQASRQRRYELSHGIMEKPVMVKLERPLTEEEGKKIVESISTDEPDEPVEKPVENYVAPNQAETVIVEPKPRKKKTTRKKKAE